MINEESIYTIVCDHRDCDENLTGEVGSRAVDVEQLADDEGWEVGQYGHWNVNTHYCPQHNESGLPHCFVDEGCDELATVDVDGLLCCPEHAAILEAAP